VRYYDTDNLRLIYIENNATKDYWDEHWGPFLLNDIYVKKTNLNFCVQVTNRYLPRGSRILEGGCGKANNVYALHKSGYKCTGIDFAQDTVERINELAPELDVKIGDVFSTDFHDESFDGYWSLGVIEHFWDGYSEISKDMNRIIKPGGYLFLTVPVMSPIRRLKAFFGGYENCSGDKQNENFYQFALDPISTTEHFEKIGFELKERFYFDAVKGLKDEVPILHPLLQKVYNGEISRHWFYKKWINRIFDRFAGHCVCLVLRKQG